MCCLWKNQWLWVSVTEWRLLRNDVSWLLMIDDWSTWLSRGFNPPKPSCFVEHLSSQWPSRSKASFPTNVHHVALTSVAAWDMLILLHVPTAGEKLTVEFSMFNKEIISKWWSRSVCQDGKSWYFEGWCCQVIACQPGADWVVEVTPRQSVRQRWQSSFSNC